MMRFGRGIEGADTQTPFLVPEDTKPTQMEKDQPEKRSAHKAEAAIIAALAFLGSAKPAEAGDTYGKVLVGVDTANRVVLTQREMSNQTMAIENERLRDMMNAAMEGQRIEAGLLMQQINALQEESRQNREMKNRSIEVLVNLIQVAKDNEGKIPPELFNQILPMIKNLANDERNTEITSKTSSGQTIGTMQTNKPRVESDKARMAREAMEKGRQQAQ